MKKSKSIRPSAKPAPAQSQSQSQSKALRLSQQLHQPGQTPTSSQGQPVQPITPALREWILARALEGMHPDEMLSAMIGTGWQQASAAAALRQVLMDFVREAEAEAGVASFSDSATGPQQERIGNAAPMRFTDDLPEPALGESPHSLVIEGHTVRVLMQLKIPRVVVFGEFLTPAECSELMRLALPRLTVSHTVDTDTGGDQLHPSRTSDGMFFDCGQHPVIARIERRIAALLNWPVERGEGLQILRYRPGAEYKPHYDYFDPALPGAPVLLARGGQRVGTFIMYLQSPERGGGTTFPDVHLEVGAVQGNAVFFSYGAPSPATRTLHGGAPVLAGEKWVATKWLRESRFQ